MSDDVSGSLDAPVEVLNKELDVKSKPKVVEGSKFVKAFSQKNSQVSSSVPVNGNIVPVEKVNPASVFEKAFGGGKVTVDQNVHELGVADDNLGMKTEVNDPLVMSVFEMLGDRAAEKGYVRTSAVYRNIVKAVKTNMVSFRRGGRKEMVDILTAQRQAELANPQIVEDNKLLGAKGGRR